MLGYGKQSSYILSFMTFDVFSTAVGIYDWPRGKFRTKFYSLGVIIHKKLTEHIKTNDFFTSATVGE